MKRVWDTEDLIEHWTLTTDDLVLLERKTGQTRLGFALLLKAFQYEGRFPQHKNDIPGAVVAHVAAQVEVAPEEYLQYDWHGRSIEYHRAQIRSHLGFRAATVQDGHDLVAWLLTQDVVYDQHREHVAAALYARCRELQVEPPTTDRVDRLVRSAMHGAEERLCATILSRLSAPVLAELDLLVNPSPAEAAPVIAEDEVPLHALKTDPGRVSLESVLNTIAKLQRLQRLGLPADLFHDVSPKLLAAYRNRAAAEPPRELRAHAAPVRDTLLAALCAVRSQEITDNFVDLLISVVHKLGVRAEHKVDRAILAEAKHVPGKHALLYHVAEASLEHPDERVRDVVFEAAGGEQRLRDVVSEYRSTHSYQARVHTVMRRSYSHHYRRMVPTVLTALRFRSNNVVHQPVIRALRLLEEYAESPVRYYPPHEDVPLEGVVRSKERALVVERGKRKGARVNRINYEICVLQALRDGLRSREIWVEGAARFGNPAHDLPADYEEQRAAYYTALDQPQEAATFIAALQREMRTELKARRRARPTPRSSAPGMATCVRSGACAIAGRG
jgi:hypothetical protein